MREALSPRQHEAEALMQQLLKDDFISLAVKRYSLHEEFDQDHCTLSCEIVSKPGDETHKLEGTGVGMLSAFFHALCARYEQEHPSLKSIVFSSFMVKGLMADASDDQASDAQAEAIIGLSNSEGVEFEFRAVSRSVSQSSMEALLEGVEYFINAERAYIRAYKALEHYKKEHRPDLVEKYTSALAVMVRNTSYSATIERLKSEKS